jgi:ketosteroid isomerase-like protein
MSQENVEVVRLGFEMGNRDGIEGIIKFIDMAWAPDGELRATGRLPDVGPVRGREAVKNWWRQLLEEVDLRVETEEYIDAGDAVVVVARQIARGRASGAEVANRLVYVCGFRGEKVTYFDAYRTKAEALEAVGLPE